MCLYVKVSSLYVKELILWGTIFCGFHGSVKLGIKILNEKQISIQHCDASMKSSNSKFNEQTNFEQTIRMNDYPEMLLHCISIFDFSHRQLIFFSHQVSFAPDKGHKAKILASFYLASGLIFFVF